MSYTNLSSHHCLDLYQTLVSNRKKLWYKALLIIKEPVMYQLNKLLILCWIQLIKTLK